MFNLSDGDDTAQRASGIETQRHQNQDHSSSRTNQTETMPKAKRKKRRSSCPKGWVPAGITVPVRLTKGQEAYCQRAVGIARFCYNLSVATQRFCRANRLRQPGWMNICGEFNRVRRKEFHIVTEVSSKVAERAFMDFGKAVDNWRNKELRSRAPKFKKKEATGTGPFRAASAGGHMARGTSETTLPATRA